MLYIAAQEKSLGALMAQENKEGKERALYYLSRTLNGAARQEGAGAGVVFVSPQRQILLYLFSLRELCTNNVAEYQALIIGLQMAIEMGISQLEILGDSKLVIHQILEQYDVKKEDLIPYCKYAKKLLSNFEAITLEHIPRKENRQVETLANLAIALALSQEETTKVAIS